MSKITFTGVKEFFVLLKVNIAVQTKSFVEYVKVLCKYYGNVHFAKADLSMVLTYLFDNPFTISKRFLMKKGELDVYTYGETPLTTMEQIANECGISKSDTVYELGAGRGRTCFWLNSFVGCKVVGIEQVPAFVERATRIASSLHVDGVTFREQDMLKTDLSGATVIYLYGTCYEASFIEKLIDKFKALPSGAKIITVSYPLSDYTSKPLFEVMKRFPATFTWGNADVYLQLKK